MDKPKCEQCGWGLEKIFEDDNLWYCVNHMCSSVKITKYKSKEVQNA